MTTDATPTAARAADTADAAPVGSTLLLRTAARLLVPLGLLFAFGSYFKGHHSPGGGFVAGLVYAVVVVVCQLTWGSAAARRLGAGHERAMIAAGLGVALATAAVPLAFGRPFFTSAHGTLRLPGGASFEWASVMAFDLGVALVVAGVVLAILGALQRERP